MFFGLQTENFYKSIVNFDVQGKKGVTAVTLGVGSYVAGGSLGISDEGYSHLLIGNYTSIANNTYFVIGINHGYERFSNYPFDDVADITGDWKIDEGYINISGERNPKQLIIGHDVWLGTNVTVMGGVRIGNGAVIGAGSVVTKNVEPYTIVAGVPAKVIKLRCDKDLANRLVKIKWWNLPSEIIKDNFCLFNSPICIEVVERIEQLVNN